MRCLETSITEEPRNGAHSRPPAGLPRGILTGPEGHKAASAKDGEIDVLAKLAEMQESDRAMAERLRAIVKASAPSSRRGPGTGCRRTPRTETSSATSSPRRSSARYATLGFSDKVNLDDGAMWPTEYALKKVTRADEARIRALVKQAVS